MAKQVVSEEGKEEVLDKKAAKARFEELEKLIPETEEMLKELRKERKKLKRQLGEGKLFSIVIMDKQVFTLEW